MLQGNEKRRKKVISLICFDEIGFHFMCFFAVSVAEQRLLEKKVKSQH